MELIDNFQEETWKKGNCEITKGFTEYRIIRSFTKDGYFEYAMFDNDGGMSQVRLYGSSSKTYNPLNGLNNVQLIVDEDLCVIGVIVEDECVVKKGSKAEQLQEEEAGKLNQINHVEEESPQTNGDAKEPVEEEDGDISLSVRSVSHCATCTCHN